MVSIFKNSYFLDELSLLVTELVGDLHRVVADTAEAVHTPAEGKDGAASLFIPDIHRLPAGNERALPLVVVNASEHRLQDTSGLLDAQNMI